MMWCWERILLSLRKTPPQKNVPICWLKPSAHHGKHFQFAEQFNVGLVLNQMREPQPACVSHCWPGNPLWWLSRCHLLLAWRISCFHSLAAWGKWNWDDRMGGTWEASVRLDNLLRLISQATKFVQQPHSGEVELKILNMATHINCSKHQDATIWDPFLAPKWTRLLKFSPCNSPFILSMSTQKCRNVNLIDIDGNPLWSDSCSDSSKHLPILPNRGRVFHEKNIWVKNDCLTVCCCQCACVFRCQRSCWYLRAISLSLWPPQLGQCF